MDKATYVFQKIAKDSNSPINYESAIELPVAGGLALSSAKSFKARHKPKVVITYGYKQGLGGSHQTLAKNVNEILKEKGVKNTELVNAMNPKDVRTYIRHRKQYAHKIDAGWGLSMPIKNKNKTVLSTDLAEKNFVLGSNGGEVGSVDLHTKYNIPKDKKIITISAGETGSVLDAKTTKLLEAVKGRKDVHVVALAANAKPQIKENLKKMPVTVEEFLPRSEFNKVMASSHLNINSGNPQTVLDQLKFKNPNMNIYTPKYVTERNALNATKRYGMPSADFSKPEFKSLVNEMLDNPSKYKTVQETGLKTYKGELKAFSEGLVGDIAKSVKTFKGRALLKGVGLALAGGALAYKGIHDATKKKT